MRVEHPNKLVIADFLKLTSQLLSSLMFFIKMLALVLRHLFALFNQFDYALRFDSEEFLEVLIFWLRASFGMQDDLFINRLEGLLGRDSL